MDIVTILAAADTAAKKSQSVEQVVPMDLFWEQITSLSPVEALTFISFGTICLFYGLRVFKILVTISFALIGLGLGITAGDKISGEDAQLWGGLAGMGLIGFLSLPLMRWAVSILGGLAGGVLTSGLWYACDLPEQYIWAGGLVGVVAGGMVSFIIFDLSVMLFTSLGGSTLIITGGLAILHQNPETAENINQLFFDEKWFLPGLLLVPTVIGMAIQNKFIKKSSKD